MFGWDFLLMLSRDSEDKMWSRFLFELLIWLQEATLAKWTQSSGPLCLWQCFLSNGQLGAMTSMLWRRFKTIMQLLTNKLSKKYFTDHEILYINDINIFVSKIFTFWTQYSGYSWYFLCSSWNTNMKHHEEIRKNVTWKNLAKKGILLHWSLDDLLHWTFPKKRRLMILLWLIFFYKVNILTKI